MSPRHEEREIAGYELVQLSPETSAAPQAGATDAVLDALEQRLERIERDIEKNRADLAEAERLARLAVDTEDAQRAASTWKEKRRLLERATALRQEQTDARRELESGMQAMLSSLRADRAELERQQAQQDSAWERLIASAQEALDQLRRANQQRAALNRRELAWQSRFERLAERQLPMSDGLHVLAAQTPALAWASPPEPGADAARPQAAATRKWALYDPDAGRLVNHLPELLRLLARWYPGLRTDRERVREFLTLPNAEPLPEKLRQELRDAGLLETGEAAPEQD